MRHLVRTVLFGCLMTGPLCGLATAVSIDDLINLKANGLGDDVLVALIQTDGSSFRLSAGDVLALSRRGLSDKVILAMVESGRKQAASTPAVNESSETAARQKTETHHVVLEPAVVHVQQTVIQRVDSPAIPVIIAVPVVVPARVVAPVRVREPEYWGFGGKLRSDAWTPATPAKDRDRHPDTPSPKDRH